jgi:hypothetical protein
MKLQKYLAALCVPAISISQAALALTITQPTAGTHVVTAGDDYATRQFSDPWDMNNAADIATAESGGATSQTFSGGIFSFVTTNADAGFVPLSQGLAGTINLSRGESRPVATNRYRYLTVKMRMSAASGPALTQQQPSQAYFLRDGASYGEGTYGFSNFIYLDPNQWAIVTYDMIGLLHPSSPHTWTEYPQIRGLRIDPNGAANVRVEVDWIRLTAPATSQQKFNVSWSDTQSGTYTVAAVDTDGTVATLATGITGTSHQADLSKLPPGDWRIRVSRNGANALSPGLVHINAPPVVTITAPNVRGNQADNYAANDAGNPWGPMDPGDVLLTGSLTNIRYDNPPGTFYARPTSGDPGLTLNTTRKAIDTNYYRSLCVTMQVFGPRDIGLGSVARIFWGTTTPTVSTSKDLVIEEGVNEYCIPDLAAVPLEPNSPTQWAGQLTYFRWDPHEFAPTAACTNTPTPESCREVRIQSIVLSPFARTNPGYVVRWNLADADTSTASVAVSLDPDRNPDNGNDIALGNVSAANGAGEFGFMSTTIPAGTYYVRLVTNDGVDGVSLHSDGPIVVGPPPDRLFRAGFN